MALNHHFYIGRDVEESACGKRWTFSRFTRGVWIALGKEGKKLIPNPVEEAIEPARHATAVDAEIIRDLMVKDEAEGRAAQTEQRAPFYLMPGYRPLSETIVEKAYAVGRRYLSAGSPELQEFINSIEGGSHLFYLLLKPKHPDITEDVAYDVYFDLYQNRGRDGRKLVRQIVDECSGAAAEAPKNAEAPAAN